MNALDELRFLVADPDVGEAAEVALYCVQFHGADPRLMLAILKAAKEGFEARTKAERDRQRYAQRDR